jgi:hypothetical protein
MRNLDKRIERTEVKINDYYGGDDVKFVMLENQLAIMQTLKELNEKLDNLNIKLNPIRGFEDIKPLYMNTEKMKVCVISRYDHTIKNPPFLTIPLDRVEVPQPVTDKYGEEFAERLKSACRNRGYFFKFYISSQEEGVDYELVVV